MPPALVLAALLAASVLPSAVRATEPERTGYQQRPRADSAPLMKTGKERLGGKSTDEQRVDDCKVPPERRTRPRPAACPWEFGS